MRADGGPLRAVLEWAAGTPPHPWRWEGVRPENLVVGAAYWLLIQFAGLVWATVALLTFAALRWTVMRSAAKALLRRLDEAWQEPPSGTPSG